MRPSAATRWNSSSPIPPYPADKAGSGYLWGYIDLVFRREGRYYLLDWKSNWLEEYGPASLDRSIRESRYDLQYMLYSMALDRWLRSVQPGYDFDRHFGGLYYIYLRGMRADAPIDGSGRRGARLRARRVRLQAHPGAGDDWYSPPTWIRALGRRPRP